MSRLPVPVAVLDQHTIALGKTGSGKSSKLRVLVEHLLEQGEPVCILDPKGDWWGLKSSADGKSAGYPVVIFGGKHADVPLNPRAGAAMAELIFTGNRPSIIDMRELRPGDRTRFFIDFASTVFKVTTGKRWLAVSEVHNFAFKGKVLSPDAGEMLYWANRLASEGRGLGINLLLDSQRPQKVHNDILDSCETLIACRTIHKSGREAIKDWIDGCADPEQGKVVLRELAGMPRPEAYVWSPEINFGPKRIEFPMFHTYDSFKPQTTAPKKLKGWAEVDLARISTQLAIVVSEIEANDPKTLKLRIRQLETALAKRPIAAPAAPSPTIDSKAIEARGFARGVAENSQSARRAAAASLKALRVALRQGVDTILDGAEQGLKEATSLAAPTPHTPPREPSPSLGKTAAPVQRPAPRSGNVDASIGKSGGKYRIMVTLAQHGRMNERRLSLLAGLSSKGGTWGTYLSALRTAGYIEGTGELAATDAGLAALGSYDPAPTGDALIQYWRDRIGGGGRLAIFNALVEAYPNAVEQEELARSVDLSSAGGTWGTYLSSLRTMELITGKKELRAAEDLFT